MLDFQLAERVVALEQQVSWLRIYVAVLAGVAAWAVVILFTGRK